MIKFEMPSSLKTPFIEVFYQPGDYLFICGVNGNVTTWMLNQIEDSLGENEEHTFDKGPGTYLFKATYDPGQYNDEGRCELPPCWDLELVYFMPNEQR